MSNEQFKRDFANLLQKAGEKADLVVRKTALDLQSSMIERSPVDTGRFRSNWACGVGVVNTATDAAIDTSGAAAIGRTQTVLEGWKTGQTITLSNSLPYARRLEFGWSKQAPGGFVRLTVQNYTRALATAVASIK